MENGIFIATEHFWSPSWHKQQTELWQLLQNWQSYLFFTWESPHPWLVNIWKLFKNRNTSLLLPSKSVAKTVWPAYKLLILFPLFALWNNEEMFPCSMGRAAWEELTETFFLKVDLVPLNNLFHSHLGDCLDASFSLHYSCLLLGTAITDERLQQK